MNYFYLILLAVAPGIALVAFILLHDRYDKEPFSLLVKVFFFGVLSTIPVILVELGLLHFNVFPGLFGIVIQAFVVIAATEEFFKRKVVLRFAFNHPAFNERLDGIVYCCMASLGFATAENIFYVLMFSAGVPDIWLTRAFLSVPAHMLLGIIMGYYLGMAKFCWDKPKAEKYFRRALFVPILLHGTFDFLLMIEQPLFSLLLVPFVIYLWISGMIKLRKYYKESKDQHC